MPAQKLISLHSLVNEVVIEVLPFAVRRRTLIVNDVQPGLHVNINVQQLTTLLKNLLCNTIMNTQDDCIRVTAKAYGSITVVHVRNNDFRCEQIITNNLQDFEGIAEQLGGCLSVTKNKLYGASVSFTFLNL